MKLNRIRYDNELRNEAPTLLVGYDNMLNILSRQIFGDNVRAGWWTDPDTCGMKDRNQAELICLMHSELSEAMEAVRKNLMDDKLPEYDGVTVELADCIIRIMDFAGAYNLDIGSALVKKLEFNRDRADHKIENRKLEGGKKF